MITATPLDANDEDRLDRNGTPLPGVEVRIAAVDEPKRLLAAGSRRRDPVPGRKCIPRLLQGRQSTASTILPGGWVRTGDLGTLNERGSLRYLGRIKDMLKVGGENVAPLEIEEYLSTHEAIRMVQVVGRPSERYGEEPVAFVELAEGAQCTADEMIAYCAGQMASYKIPREVRFISTWPMSATKIQKIRLKEMLDQSNRVTEAGHYVVARSGLARQHSQPIQCCLYESSNTSRSFSMRAPFISRANDG